MTTDLTFFINEPDAALLDRFKAALRDVQFFDLLVGYFRTSGFHLSSEARRLRRLWTSWLTRKARGHIVLDGSRN